jgi:HD-like signal output (HDOD) protein
MDLDVRCDELREFADAAAARTDAQPLIDHIREHRSTVIRQPPLAAQRALAVTRDPNASGVEIVRLVGEDPTLTQAVLRHANSAFYATYSDPCVSLPEAVRRIGTAGVETVVLSAMVEGLLCRPGGQYQPIVDAVWSHMVRCGPIARAVAPAFGVVPEVAYSLGLLHDVGKLVVFDAMIALRSQVKRDTSFPAAFLHSALGILHEPLGGLAVLEWGLGPLAARAIATHRRASSAEFARAESEMLFIVERIDLAAVRKQPVDLEAWWEAGALTTERQRVEAQLAALQEREA